MSILRYLFGSTSGLVIALSLYTLIGSVTFMYLEDGVEIESLVSTEKSIDEEINELKEKIGRSETRSLEDFRLALKKRLIPTKNKNVDIWQALFYCFTIYTSIGYGNIVPGTLSSKFFTCIYGFLGIPLCVLTLDKIGKVINKALKCCAMSVDGSGSRKVDSYSISIYFMVAVMMSYMLMGYFLYRGSEKWSSGDTLYFLFITFTTIGFGDISPGDSKFFILTIIYQFVGLSLMASLINLVVSKFDVNLEADTEVKNKCD